MAELHKDDYGTVLRALVQNSAGVAENVSSATDIYFYLAKPNADTILTKSGQFTTDGSDGYIEYTTVSGDIDMVGVWSIQGHVLTPSGNYKTSISEFYVQRNLL